MNRRPDTERTADAIDEGTRVGELFKDASVSMVRARLAPESYHSFDGVHCVEEDCGVDLPEQRLTDGRIRCVDCQQLKEERIKRGQP